MAHYSRQENKMKRRTLFLKQRQKGNKTVSYQFYMKPEDFFVSPGLEIKGFLCVTWSTRMF